MSLVKQKQIAGNHETYERKVCEGGGGGRLSNNTVLMIKHVTQHTS